MELCGQIFGFGSVGDGPIIDCASDGLVRHNVAGAPVMIAPDRSNLPASGGVRAAGAQLRIPINVARSYEKISRQ